MNLIEFQTMDTDGKTASVAVQADIVQMVICHTEMREEKRPNYHPDVRSFVNTEGEMYPSTADHDDLWNKLKENGLVPFEVMTNDGKKVRLRFDKIRQINCITTQKNCEEAVKNGVKTAVVFENGKNFIGVVNQDTCESIEEWQTLVDRYNATANSLN